MTVERLRQVPLFADLSPADLEHLVGISRVLELPRKRVLFTEGEPYRGMYLVLDGLAVVYKTSGEGRMLILEVCRPGDVIADVPLFEEQDAGYPAHAKTTRDSSILFLPQQKFAPFVRTRPEIAWRMLQSFAGRMKEKDLRLEGVTLREVSSRLARYLLREVEAGGEGDESHPELTLPLAKSSVASYLGTAHETLSRTFAKLIRERVISVDGPRITILDKKKLRRLV